jgi:hypothetical protein
MGEHVQAEIAAARALGHDGEAIETVGTGYQLCIARARMSRNDGDLAGALEDLAELDLLRGEHALAVAELSGIAAEHPYRERAWELLMIELYRGGHQADALAVYHDGRRLLADELGANPGLQRVYDQVLRADAALDMITAIPDPRSLCRLARTSPRLGNFNTVRELAYRHQRDPRTRRARTVAAASSHRERFEWPRHLASGSLHGCTKPAKATCQLMTSVEGI